MLFFAISLVTSCRIAFSLQLTLLLYPLLPLLQCAAPGNAGLASSRPWVCTRPWWLCTGKKGSACIWRPLSFCTYLLYSTRSSRWWAWFSSISHKRLRMKPELEGCLDFTWAVPAPESALQAFMPATFIRSSQQLLTNTFQVLSDLLSPKLFERALTDCQCTLKQFHQNNSQIQTWIEHIHGCLTTTVIPSFLLDAPPQCRQHMASLSMLWRRPKWKMWVSVQWLYKVVAHESKGTFLKLTCGGFIWPAAYRSSFLPCTMSACIISTCGDLSVSHSPVP